LHDAGVTTAPDVMWFNLNPDARAAARPWLQSTSLRRAVSMAVDRTAIVNTVYLGEAVPIAGPVTPGHGKWYDASIAAPVLDRARARAELDAAGLKDRDGDGIREDASGQPAKFSLLTQKGHSVRERTAAVVQEHLKQIGLVVDVVALDVPSMIDRFGKKDYEAMLFGFEFDAFDPARHVDFWTSRGGFHVWRPRQTTPATSWEARIDDLMAKQSTTLDDAERRRLFNDARKVLAEEQPALYFAAPRVILATSARVQGVKPSVLSPNILWNAEGLSIAGPRR
jgi:peptide/nickel transport system substrate-binding protein